MKHVKRNSLIIESLTNKSMTVEQLATQYNLSVAYIKSLARKEVLGKRDQVKEDRVQVITNEINSMEKRINVNKFIKSIYVKCGFNNALAAYRFLYRNNLLSLLKEKRNSLSLKHIQCVYVIECLKSDKVYIGSTSELERRIGIHLASLRSGTHYCADLQQMYNQYGEQNFTFKIVFEVANRNNLVKMEKNVVRSYNERALNTLLADNKKNKDYSLKCFKVLNNTNRYNKPKAVKQYTLTGEYVATWRSAKHAADTLKFNQGNICSCLNGKLTSANKFIWKFC